MRGLLGVPGEHRPRSKLRLDIWKQLLNGTIFQMDDLKTEEDVKEFKEVEIVQALRLKLQPRNRPPEPPTRLPPCIAYYYFMYSIRIIIYIYFTIYSIIL